MTDRKMKWEDRITDWTATYRDRLESFQLSHPDSEEMRDICSE